MVGCRIGNRELVVDSRRMAHEIDVPVESQPLGLAADVQLEDELIARGVDLPVERGRDGGDPSRRRACRR